jgi:hypothetical protein
MLEAMVFAWQKKQRKPRSLKIDVHPSWPDYRGLASEKRLCLEAKPTFDSITFLSHAACSEQCSTSPFVVVESNGEWKLQLYWPVSNREAIVSLTIRVGIDGPCAEQQKLPIVTPLPHHLDHERQYIPSTGRYHRYSIVPGWGDKGLRLTL